MQLQVEIRTAKELLMLEIQTTVHPHPCHALLVDGFLGTNTFGWDHQKGLWSHLAGEHPGKLLSLPLESICRESSEYNFSSFFWLLCFCKGRLIK